MIKSNEKDEIVLFKFNIKKIQSQSKYEKILKKIAHIKSLNKIYLIQELFHSLFLWT
jgi:hypothetical protein